MRDGGVAGVAEILVTENVLDVVLEPDGGGFGRAVVAALVNRALQIDVGLPRRMGQPVEQELGRLPVEFGVHAERDVAAEGQSEGTGAFARAFAQTWVEGDPHRFVFLFFGVHGERVWGGMNVRWHWILYDNINHNM